MKTCPGCGFTYMATAPKQDALFERMSWEKSSGLESEWRQATRGIQQRLSRRTRWRLHLFPRNDIPSLMARLAEPGNIVDLGCGGGAKLDRLPEGFVSYGIEISQALAAAADARFEKRGGRALNAPGLDGLRQFEDGFFTGALLRSHLEHELHPKPVLVELRRVLRPGAVALVKVPNYASWNRRVMGRRWCGFRHPDHLNYFTPATLRTLAGKAGLQTGSGPGWRLPTSDNMWALLRKVA